MRLNSKLGGIMVLSAYQVGNQLDFNNGKKGSKTARLQQHSMLQIANHPSLEEMRKDLLQAQLMLMNYAIKHSYVYRRWLNVVNMMILKDEGDTRVYRL